MSPKGSERPFDLLRKLAQASASTKLAVVTFTDAMQCVDTASRTRTLMVVDIAYRHMSIAREVLFEASNWKSQRT